MHRSRWSSVGLALVMTVLLTPFSQMVVATPNPVATNDALYAAYGRVFSDPQGCRVQDVDGDGVNDVVPPGVSPWAKGKMCMTQFLSYEEAISGTQYLASRYSRYLQLIRLDQAYNDSNMMSAGIPRAYSVDSGTVKPIETPAQKTAAR